MREGAEAWKHGVVHIGPWHYETELILSRLAKTEDYPYRITFAVEGKDVLPVQQCVDWQREAQHAVCCHGWYKKGDCLMEFEISPVQDQLGAYSAQRTSDAEEFATEGPLRKLLLITMKPAKNLLMFRWQGVKDKRQFIHEKVGTYLCTGTAPARMAVFGYDLQWEKWVLLQNGTWLSIADTVRKLSLIHI